MPEHSLSLQRQPDSSTTDHDYSISQHLKPTVCAADWASKMLHDLLTIVWVFLPAGLANTAPVLAANITWLKNYTAPIDMNKKFRGKRILGDHKTFRGLLAGVVMGCLIASVQLAIATGSTWPASHSAGLDYGSAWIIVVGGLLGLGALCGDSIKSFFKRQLGIAPGKSWFPFDQLDYLVGALLASLPFIHLTMQQYIVFFVFGLILHPLGNLLGWLLHLQDHPY